MPKEKIKKIHKTVTHEVRQLRLEILQKVTDLMTAGLGLVAALAWNEAIKAFFKVFLLQGLIMLVVALPIMVVFSSSSNQLTVFSFIGFIIFAFGFLFESIGDLQMYCFKRKPENKGKIITSGL